MNSLPLEAMVYLIVDGTEHFARPDERRREFREVCSQLVQVFREKRGAKVRLLFTSTQKSVILEELGLLMDDEIVDISRQEVSQTTGTSL